MLSLVCVQASEELRLPVELGEVQAALEAAYADVAWQGQPLLALEMRASLSCAASWAPMVSCWISKDDLWLTLLSLLLLLLCSFCTCWAASLAMHYQQTGPAAAGAENASFALLRCLSGPHSEFFKLEMILESPDLHTCWGLPWLNSPTDLALAFHTLLH